MVKYRRNQTAAWLGSSALLLFLVISCMIAHAADATWTGTLSSNWSTGANWSAGATPGSTTSLTSTDTATFNAIPPGPVLVTIDQANQNIGSIDFGIPGKYTIGTTTGNALLLSSGGSIYLTPSTITAVAATVNAPLVLEAASSTSNGVYTFRNDDNHTNDYLQFGGAISGGTTTGSITLNLTGLGTHNNTISGAISNGSALGGLAVTVGGTSVWTLSGSNTYSGATTINGGTLLLTGSLNSSTSLIMSGGTFTDSSSGTFQTVNGLTILQGMNTVNASTAKTLTLGTLTRNSAALIDFNNGVTGSTVISNSGFLGPWALYGSTTNLSYASGGGGAAAVSAYNGGTAATAGSFLNMTSSAVNYTYTGGNVALQFDSVGNTLQLTGSTTVDNQGHTLTLNGLLVANSNIVNIKDGSLAVGSSNELDIVNGAGQINISANLTGSGTVVIASLGGAGVTLSGINFNSGGIILEAGTLYLNSGSALGSGTFTISNGAVIGNSSGSKVTIANNNSQVWSGSFTINAADELSMGTGNITLNANSVIVTNSGTLVTFAENIGGTGNLSFSGGNVTLNGSINNLGTLTAVGGYLTNLNINGNIGTNVTGLIVNGNGSLNSEVTLTGSNSYTSGTTILNAGTLLVGNGGTTGNLGSGGVLDNGILIYQRSNTYTENNVISGTGSVQQFSNSTLILTAANTYSGDTLAETGTIQLSGAGTLGGPASSLTFSSGSVDLNGTNQTIGTLNAQFTLGTIYNSSVGTTSVLSISGSGGSFSGLIENNTGTGGVVSLVKTGTGQQYLNGVNTYTGGTTIASGTLEIGNPQSLGSGPVTDNGVLSLYNFNGATESAQISGSGSVYVINGVNLTGSNSFTGGITLAGGTTTLGNAGAIGPSGTITFSGGTLQFTSSNTTDYSSRFSNATSQDYYIDTNGQSVTFASNLTSTFGVLEKFGVGTLTLTGTNSYTGGTLVSAGILQIAGGGTLGSTSGSMTLSGTSVLDLGNTTQTQGAVSIQGGTLQNGTLRATGFSVTGTSTINANLTGTANLNVSSSGSLVFTGQGGYTLGTTVSGFMQVGAGGTTGSLGSGGIVGSGSSAKLVYDRSDAITEANSISGSLTLTQNGGGTLNLTGTNTFTGNININSGAISITSTIALGSASNAIAVSSGGALQIQGGINVGNAISMAGTGISSNGAIENISGTNTISGQIVSAGNATIGSDAGTLVINGLTPITGGGSLTLTGSGNGVLTSNIYLGAVSVIKSGSGLWTLSGNSTYSGTTNITDGTLSISTIQNAGTAQPLGESGTVTFSGASASASGVLQYTGTTVTMHQNLNVLTGDYGTIYNTGGGVLTLSGGVNKNGSVLTLAGGRFVVAGSITGIATNSDLDIGNTAYPGSAIVGLTATNTYNGPTSITDGSTLLTGIAGALPVSTPSAVTLGGTLDTAGQTNTLDLLGTNQIVASLTATGTAVNQVISSNGTANGTPGTGSGASSGTGTLTINYSGGTTDTYSGSLGGSGLATKFGLVKSGTGVLLLSGTNTYTGGTTVNAGTLIAGRSTVLTTLGGTTTIASGAFGTGLLTLGTGSTLDDNGVAITLANSLSLSGTISLGSTGNGSLTFDGTTLTTPATVTLTGNTLLIVSNTTTIADNIAGNFSLTKTGTGTLNITGTNSSTAGTAVTSGAVAFSNASSLGTGGISLANGTALQYTGSSSGTVANAITVTGGTGQLSNSGGSVLTLSGSLNKTGTVLDFSTGKFVVTGQITGNTGSPNSDVVLGTPTGSTTVGLTNTNTYNGPTTIYNGSTLLTGVNGALPTGTPTNLTLGSSSDNGVTNTLDLLGTQQTVNSLTSLSGTTTPAINQIISSNGSASTPTIGGTISPSTGQLTITGTASSTYTGLLGDSNGTRAANNFGVTMASTGSLTLTNANSYSGGTTVSSGTLIVSNTTGSATGTGTINLSSGTTLTGTGTITNTTATANNLNGIIAAGANGIASATGSMTITGTSAFGANANLVFNLNDISVGGAHNEINVGSSTINFLAGSTLTLNLLNSGTTNFTPGQQYVLLAGTTGATYTGVSNIILNLPGLASTGATNQTYYGSSFIIVTGNNLDIVVVPEPETWVLTLGGLALLLVFQIRCRKKSCVAMSVVDRNNWSINQGRSNIHSTS